MIELSLIKKDYVVVDVGANIGVFTLKASKSVGNKGLVVAIEPEPLNYNTLLKNISINRLTKSFLVNSHYLHLAGKVYYFFVKIF